MNECPNYITKMKKSERLDCSQYYEIKCCKIMDENYLFFKKCKNGRCKGDINECFFKKYKFSESDLPDYIWKDIPKFE